MLQLLSQLPVPLLNVSFSRVAAAIRLKDVRYRNEAVKALLLRIPTPHFELLKHICYFLNLLLSARQWNNTNSTSVVGTFSQFVMSPDPADEPNEIINRATVVTDLTLTLITDFHSLFSVQSTRPANKQEDAGAAEQLERSAASSAERERLIANQRKCVIKRELADIQADRRDPFLGKEQLKITRVWLKDDYSPFNGQNSIDEAQKTIQEILSHGAAM